MRAIRRITTPRSPRARMVCFPHAGGTAAFFHPWRRLVPPDVELWAVQYPGRHDRVLEPCLDTMDAMLGDVLPGLLDAESLPTTLLGHSLGAGIAYECARRLPHSPRLLVLSARGGPGRNREKLWSDKSDDELLDNLSMLGEISPEVVADPDLRELVMPSLRADCRLSESYDPDPRHRLGVPVLACVGDQDPIVTPEDTLAWEQSTTGPFTHRVYSGDHFYLRTHAADVIQFALHSMGTAPPDALGN